MRTKPFVLILTLLLAALGVIALYKPLLVVQIEGLDAVAWVSEGDEFFRTYVHSMYEAPVTEKFRIEDGRFRLVHVQSQSDAVLAYLGIEGKNEPNADETLTEFSIPAASVGKHALRFQDREISLGTGELRDGRIKVKLTRISLLTYFPRLIWR